MTKLTAAEHDLLRHPPTPKTWVCGRKRKVEDQKVECRKPNPGTRETCFLCGGKKTPTSKLLWPQYVAACLKAGIEPDGKPHRPNAASTPTAPKRAIKRKGT